MNDADFLWRYFAHEDVEAATPWIVYSAAYDHEGRQYRIQFSTEVIETILCADEDWTIRGIVFVQKARTLAIVSKDDAFRESVEILLRTDPWLSTLPLMEDVD